VGGEAGVLLMYYTSQLVNDSTDAGLVAESPLVVPMLLVARPPLVHVAVQHS
jgi:hypothetical protein